MEKTFPKLVFIISLFIIGLNSAEIDKNDVESTHFSIHPPRALAARNRRQYQPCGSRKFQCASGACIPNHQKCDGVKNCADGADETQELCESTPCASFAFRCNYGACVDGNAACNGIQECADNSDELLLQCPASTQTTAATSKNCRASKFECADGECISKQVVCDGVANCKDASDETKELCTAAPCPTFAFRCDYGACVSGDALCDRNLDCLDASDEKEEICGRPPPSPSTPSTMVTGGVPVTQNPVTAPRPPVTAAPPIAGSGACMLPVAPDFATYTLLGSPPGTVLVPFTLVNEYQLLEFKCRKDYVLKGDGKVFCIAGSWTPAIPECLRPCKPLESTTLDIYCHVGTMQVDCKNTMPPGAQANLDCKKNYKPPFIPTDVITCGEDGTWDYPLFICRPECGTLPGNGTAYVIGGKIAKIGEIPWQAAIYEKQPGKQPGQICGGSLVSARAVISAAHCFWTPGSSVPKQKDRFAVGLGKVRRGWMDDRDVYAKYSDVQNLILPQTYTDIQGNYGQDIAILFLVTTVEFTAIIKPVCVDWNFRGSVHELAPGTEGKVAGWGLTSEGGEASPELKQITLPTILRYQCIENSPQDFQSFITPDKFCAGYLNGSSVCKGDSGGGLSFPEDDHGRPVYYLRGIVSVGPTRENSCNSHKYTAFTELLEHLNFLKEHEVHLN